MKTMKLGTILPTKESLAINDAYALEQAKLNDAFAAEHMAQHDQKLVAGEVRYYADATHYAVVRHQRARWFEVRADGDYAIKRGGAQ